MNIPCNLGILAIQKYSNHFIRNNQIFHHLCATGVRPQQMHIVRINILSMENTTAHIKLMVMHD